MSKIKHIVLAALLVVSTSAYVYGGDISGGRAGDISGGRAGDISGGKAGDISGGKYLTDILLVLLSLAQ